MAKKVSGERKMDNVLRHKHHRPLYRGWDITVWFAYADINRVIILRLRSRRLVSTEILSVTCIWASQMVEA